MPKTIVPAAEGDTLCGLAITAGFLDCAPLRDEPANAGLLDRDLAAGDLVTIPERDVREESRSSGATHGFVVQNVPPVLVRFVHGSKDKHYREDDTSTFLNVSNYITNKGGANGQQALPTATVYDARGDADPDAFKIEVVDPAGPANVTVKLEALQPIYADDGRTILRHESFGESERELDASCKKVPSGVCYRSPYLRLVADRQDKAGLPAQTLLVTDLADGLGGANDAVEILDQLVRVSYVRAKCPGVTKCTVRATVPIAPDKQRVRVAFHLYRPTFNAAPDKGVNGIDVRTTRKRLFGHFRRIFAQAGLAPRLVAPIEFLDPPRARMLTLSEPHGRAASGVEVFGKQSFITFKLAPAFDAPDFPGDDPSPSVSVRLSPGMSPTDAGAAIVAALPAGFSGEALAVARATDGVDGACDVMIRRDDGDGTGVVIRDEQSTDATMTLTVTRMGLWVDADFSGTQVCAMTNEVRRIIRESPGSDDQLDVYAIEQLTDGTYQARGTLGLGVLTGSDMPPGGFAAVPPIRNAALLSAYSAFKAIHHTLDDGPLSPTTFAHEACHVLAEVFHPDHADPNARTCVMWDGKGDDVKMDVGTKRLVDDPVGVRLGVLDPDPAAQAASPGARTWARVSMTQRLRTRGAAVFEPW